MQPYLKRCRTLGISPSVMGVNKESNRNPGPQRKSKKSEYALQLNEKQKVKFIYGVLEKQFRSYYEKAARMKGNTGDELMTLLERRLDNVVFRLGLANTRREARQLVNHGHFTIDGKRVNIPSYLVKAGDVVAIVEKSMSSDKIKGVLEANASRPALNWLSVDKNKAQATVVNLPERGEIDLQVEEQLIVELYSK
jgi:small subunit ribosomal protein S4